MIMVVIIANTDILMPIYPMYIRDNCTGLENVGGFGLSKMAKCVRWLHPQTVLESEESSLMLEHPDVSQFPVYI